MPQINQLEKIEEYHSGNMSAGDIDSFEKELASDPSLKAESDFQSNIIEGIKEYRKTQLKSRLNALDVSPGWMEFVQQSALVKSFGGIAIATIVGSGVYFFAEKNVEKIPESNSISKIEIEGPAMEPSSTWAIPMSSAKTETRKINAEAIEDKNETSDVVLAEKTQLPKVNVVVDPSKEATSDKSFVPQFTTPEAGDVSDDKELASNGLDKIPVVSATKNNEPIEVETKNSKSSKIRYKFYDGKLFLNGDFKKEPYEILEINSAKGRRIYLLHQNKYFQIKTTDRLTELPEVTDVKLIRELRLIKENK